MFKKLLACLRAPHLRPEEGARIVADAKAKTQAQGELWYMKYDQFLVSLPPEFHHSTHHTEMCRVYMGPRIGYEPGLQFVGECTGWCCRSKEVAALWTQWKRENWPEGLTREEEKS